MDGHMRGEDCGAERRGSGDGPRAAAEVRVVTLEQRRLGWAAIGIGTLMMLAGAVAAVAAGG